ncbi:MATE family efflux transporter [Oceanobacillus oncorhynchi subsp. incaldanensis]|uniref:Probable multidrug resistance protein NorM n=3 Tax=Oceanobacillus TaxID=182709 RepID=A0A0A1MTZ4_9BACI|nr:MATE family efflux transporter [Oceanobacillus oncorhynchi]MDM8102799.1 MATE family efflux transporter [Oceanobacillus oncorhynchi]GIO17618.1 MATE family efflux transporter [Oceanobacillus oncorhynchi subsp. incaldanensis]CEI83002.1 Multidrug resistance protein MdtK [Oceanobacillus oncorhynchi]
MNVADQTLKKGLSTNDKIKIIIILAVPAVIENFFQTMLGFADTFFVAQIGLDEVSAVGVTNAILAIYFAIFMAIGVGVNVLMANATGAGDYERASKVAQQGVILTTIVGGLTGMLTLIFAEPLLSLLGVEQQVLEIGVVYFRIVAVPSILMAYMFVMSSILRGVGDTKSPMKAVIIANIVNIILDYIFIFGFLFIPALGIVGAGLAGVIARLVGTFVLILYIKKNNQIMFQKNWWRFDKVYQKELLGLGAPAAGERLAMRIGQVVYFGFIVALGTSTFAAHQIAGNIETFSYMIAYGFAAAATIIVGKQVGAGNYEEAKSYAKLISILSAVFMVFMGVLLFILGEWIGGFFSEDPVVVSEISIALKIAALFQPFLAILLILTGAYQGARNTKYPMYLTTIVMWLIRTLFVYLLAIQMQLGIAGVWVAIGIDIVIRAVVMWYRMEKDKWIKSKKKMSFKDKVECQCHPKTKQPNMNECVNNY